ncbi:MAG: alpha/beta hydrolase [Roseivirga sp.]|nr:alpha/beta hydrolase [Roseivirga sp.]
MFRILLITALLLKVAFMSAQDITGQWHGALDVQGSQLRLVLHVKQVDGAYKARLDSPDQGAKGMPISSITFENNVLKFSLSNINASYNGTFSSNSFTGTWSQGGGSLALNFKREVIEKKVAKRPQEPVKPYPYLEEEVLFENSEAGIKLAGTLTLPKTAGPHPVVILISGSGPQDRNEELAEHKPFLVIADHLTRNGIAVLRYDDRGVAKSEGNFGTATTKDLATDASSAVAYLTTRSDIDQRHIGLMGHSEGGIIAPIVAAESKDVAFIVLLAGTGIPGDELLLMQSEAISSAQGVSGPMLERSLEINAGVFKLIKEATDETELEAELSKYILAEVPASFRPANMTEEEFVKSQTSTVLAPWMQYFIKYNPAEVLPQVNCPVLAVNGDKDLQVPSKVNLEAIKAGLAKGGNTQVKTIEFPGLNHLFQKTETGLPGEYGKLEETFSIEVLKEVTHWLKEQIK